jgi:hypothetical protein
VLAPVIALVKRFPIVTAIAGFALGGYLLATSFPATSAI